MRYTSHNIASETWGGNWQAGASDVAEHPAHEVERSL
jgi:hypothetical protein